MSTARDANYGQNFIGTRRLAGLISGTGGHIVLGGVTLGTAPSQITVNDLESMGYPADWINLLIGLDASDEQLQELAGIDPISSSQAAAQTVLSMANALFQSSGLPGSAPIPIDLAQAATGAPISGSSPAATGTPASSLVPTSVSQPQAQLPPGTQFSYTASWTAGFGNLSVSPNNVIANLQAKLSQTPSLGMRLVSGTATGSGPINYGVQLLISDQVGHALATDAQSVLDSLVRSLVGNNLSGSNVSPAVPGSGGSATDLTSWLTQNMGTVALVGIAAFVGFAVLRDL